jgi:hypothetical protein
MIRARVCADVYLAAQVDNGKELARAAERVLLMTSEFRTW